MGYKAKNVDLSKSHVSMNLGAGNEIPRKPTIEEKEMNEVTEGEKEKEEAESSSPLTSFLLGFTWTNP
jgi:hypothetical protein